MTENISSQKQALRRMLRQRRKAFVVERGGLPWSAPAHPLSDVFSGGMTVASYNCMGSEADATPIDALVVPAGAVLAWPRIDMDKVMRFYALGSSGQMVPDHANILAPASDALPVAPDLILLPLLGFDRRGTRLGQGAGYYDRTIAALDASRAPGTARARRIGIAWSVQEVNSLPRDDWDLPLDAIITEREWIEP